MSTQRIHLAGQRGIALIDSDDLPLAACFKWRLVAGRYAAAGDGVLIPCIYMHQLIVGCVGVDHVNGNGLDNRRVNLRPATQHQNQGNRSVRRDSASRLKGVGKKGNSFRARIIVNRKELYLGSFASPQAAALAYDAAAIKHFGDFARLNTKVTT